MGFFVGRPAGQHPPNLVRFRHDAAQPIRVTRGQRVTETLHVRDVLVERLGQGHGVPLEDRGPHRGRTFREADRRLESAAGQQKDVLLVGAEEITFSRPMAGLHLLSFGNPFVEDRHFAGFGSLTIPDVLDDHVKPLGVPAWLTARPYRVDWGGVEVQKVETANERVIQYRSPAGVLVACALM